jgi:Zn-dependent M28 family amino/carboxypeptidase
MSGDDARAVAPRRSGDLDRAAIPPPASSAASGGRAFSSGPHVPPSPPHASLASPLAPRLALLSLPPAQTQAQGTPRPDADPRIQKLVAAVSAERLRAIVAKLESFGTRSTLSDTVSTTRGIGAARRWIHEEFTRSSPKLQVAFDRHPIAQQGRITRDVELVNVVAVLPGRSPRRVYISGHYDTVNLRAAMAGVRPSTPGQQPAPNHDVDAPGANDDGSGTALTIELARVFAESGLDFDATLVFIAWAGEEQGLIGSMAHATALADAKGVVEANFNNDIVGSSLGGNGIIDAESVKIYSLGPEDSMSRSLARYIARIAGVYVPSHTIRLMAREDRFGRGSDHSSFTANNFPAVVFREASRSRGWTSPTAPERASQRRRRRLSARPFRPRGHQRARPGTHRAWTVGLRRRPQVERLARCGRLHDLLARRVGQRLAARAGGGQRHAVRAPQRLDRRLRLWRGSGRRRWQREPRERLRLAQPTHAAGQDVQVAGGRGGPDTRGPRNP